MEQTLREEGLDVSWTQPVEERGVVGDVVDSVTVTLIVNGTTAAVVAAVAEAREHLGRRGIAEIEHDENDLD